MCDSFPRRTWAYGVRSLIGLALRYSETSTQPHIPEDVKPSNGVANKHLPFPPHFSTGDKCDLQNQITKQILTLYSSVATIQGGSKVA